MNKIFTAPGIYFGQFSKGGAGYGLAAKALVKTVIALAAKHESAHIRLKTLADADKGTVLAWGFVAGLVTKERTKKAPPGVVARLLSPASATQPGLENFGFRP